MPNHTVFIVNPISGRGAGMIAATALQDLAKNAGLDFKITTTTEVGHAIRLAQEAAVDGAEVVVAVGGDGTANEVLNGLMQARLAGLGSPTMGVIGFTTVIASDKYAASGRARKEYKCIGLRFHTGLLL